MGSIAPELSRLGFEAGSTFTRQVLELDLLPKKEVPRGFITQFTIETFWGRWCPKDAWNKLSSSFQGAEEFLSRFRYATSPEIVEGLLLEVKGTQNWLIQQGLIEHVGNEHLEKWVQRIEDLRANSRRLERYYTGYDSHKMPYSIEQKNDICDLFESLHESIELAKTNNIAKKKVSEAINRQNPNLISLN